MRETMDSVMQARYQRAQESVRFQSDDPEQNPSSPLVEPPVTRTRTYLTGEPGAQYPDLAASAPTN